MNNLLLQNCLILSGFMKENPFVEIIELRNGSGNKIKKTTAVFNFYHAENQPMSTIRIVGWGKNGDELANIPLREMFTITGVLKVINRKILDDGKPNCPIVEVGLKHIQKIMFVDEENFMDNEQ